MKLHKMERTIVHLEIDGRHEYFGSPSSLFDKYTREEIGIGQAALNNYFSKLGENDESIYKNKKCTIRKGALYVKPTTRGRKKQGDNI
ncbi:MAG: hypothetical protein J6Q73_07850 [Bacteroidaceae bacterium]|nr:hypothetical protein [Bacteroidaceae bacterium]